MDKWRIAAIAGIAIIMCATNPDQRKFNDYVKYTLVAEAQPTNALERGLASIFSSLAAGVADWVTFRDNYLLFSVYRVDMGDSEMRYLGVFGNFIALN